MKKQTKKRTKPVPLVVEPHPADYSGYPFITLIQYRNQHFLTIVDNSDNESINAFVLDLCGPERVDEEMIINVANEWYRLNKDRYPISFEFSKRNISSETSKLYRTYNVEFISRVIGPLPCFPMNNIKSIKRRRRKPIPAGVEIVRK